MNTSTRNARYRVNADSWMILRDLIDSRTDFNRDQDSFRGRNVTEWDDATGRMHPAGVDHFRKGVRSGDVVYVVYSYGTPIGWRRACGTWVLASARYSVTTSKHQGRLGAAIGVRAVHTG